MQQGFHNGYPDMVWLCRNDGVGEEKKSDTASHITSHSSALFEMSERTHKTHSVTSGKMWFILLTNENLKDEDLKNGS